MEGDNKRILEWISWYSIQVVSLVSNIIILLLQGVMGTLMSLRMDW